MIDGTEGTVNRLKYMMEKEGISPDSDGEKERLSILSPAEK